MLNLHDLLLLKSNNRERPPLTRKKGLHHGNRTQVFDCKFKRFYMRWKDRNFHLGFKMLIEALKDDLKFEIDNKINHAVWITYPYRKHDLNLKCIQNNDGRELLSFVLTAFNLFNLLTTIQAKLNISLPSLFWICTL